MKENTQLALEFLMQKVLRMKQKEDSIRKKMKNLEIELQRIQNSKEELVENIRLQGLKTYDRNNNDTEETIEKKNKYNLHVQNFKIEYFKEHDLDEFSDLLKEFPILSIQENSELS